jgi:hypothetical protein
MATYTITTNDADDIRLGAAFGHKLRLNQSATQEEIKRELIGFMRMVVNNQERLIKVNSLITLDPQIEPE